MRWAIINFIEDIKHRQLAFCFPFVFIYVRHNFLNAANRSCQRAIVWIIFVGMFKNICQKIEKGILMA